MKKFFIYIIGLVLVSLSFNGFAQEVIEEGELNPNSEVDLMQLDYPLADDLSEFYQYSANDTILRLAIVLSDIYSKKDMEFTKGFLMGLQKSSLPPYSISLKIVNGEIPEDSLMYELDNFDPHVVVSTFEKDSPLSLQFYAQSHSNKLLNVFDAKGDNYQYNRDTYQILAPSDKFNNSIAKYFTQNFPEDILVILGEPDFSDLMIRDLILSWPEENILILSNEDFKEFKLDENVNYLICPLANNYKDIKDTLAETIQLLSETPGATLRIIGRPNWVAFSDLNTLISNLEVFIPAKCYFDTTSDQSKRFISNYNSSYGHSPIRSNPVFSVMGYDTALYFIPEFVKELRGEPTEWIPENMIQSYFNLDRSGEAGFFNKGSFMLHYDPWGTMKKELLN